MLGALRGVVALDGPSGTGKTTAARALASRLGAGYLDTGAMYRTVTLAVLRGGADLADGEAVAAIADEADIGLSTDPDEPVVLLDGTDVGAQVRGDDVTAAVSMVAAAAEVRQILVDAQRAIIDEVATEVGGIVVEGRDIGTVVVPDAALKVYLTAETGVRADRRHAEDAAAGREAHPEGTQAEVERRDNFDATRAADPLRAAADAVRLDTTDLELEQVIAALLDLAGERDMLVSQEEESHGEWSRDGGSGQRELARDDDREAR